MIHIEVIDELCREQVEMSERAPSVESYLENLGICPECIEVAARLWLRDNLSMAMQRAAETGESAIDAVDALVMGGYYRGFTLGLLLGREHLP